jgi:Zn-dependent membrane protease YugP
MTEAQAATEAMRADGLVGVAIESVEGMLTHYYDPRDSVPRLSHGNYFGRSLTALGVAAHGAGHALPEPRSGRCRMRAGLAAAPITGVTSDASVR